MNQEQSLQVDRDSSRALDAGNGSELLVNKFKLQFFYPFKIDQWEALKTVVNQLIDEHSQSLYEDELPKALKKLDVESGTHSFPSSEVKKIIESDLETYDNGRRRNRRRSNRSFLETARKAIRGRAANQADSEELGSELLSQMLNTLISEHEADADCRFLRFLEQRINEGSRQPLLLPATCHEYEDTGTRYYLDKKEPFLVVPLRGRDLTLINPEVLPDITQKLYRDRPTIRVRPTVKVWASGLGCLRVRVHVANEEGLAEIVDEIVFTTPVKNAIDPLEEASAKRHLTALILKEMRLALQNREVDRIKYFGDANNQVVLTAKGAADLRNRLSRIVEEVTLVNGRLTVNDIVDTQNLDRGFARGSEPRFLWDSDDARPFQFYFDFLLGEFLKNIKGVIKSGNHDHLQRFFSRQGKDRRPRELSELRMQEQFIYSLANLSVLQHWQAPERHPYVTTFIGCPAPGSPDSCSLASVSQGFEEITEGHRADIAKLLMKTKWAGLRWGTWRPLETALENVFYSNLIYIAIHLRGTICLYCVPPNSAEYLERPELKHSYKYREELRNTVENQRMLWFAYKMFDALVTSDIATISQSFTTLKEETGREEFQSMIEDLTQVIQTIEGRKLEVAEVMEEPFTRKGGSSLFSEMLERSSKAFRLEELYTNLCHKLERLDMVGIHVNETIHEYSNIMVQEGTRSTQLTLEFLEAFIIAFYAADLTHLIGLQYGEGEFPYPISESWSFYTIAIGAFLTALPIITMVRKSRARFPVRDPSWLERLEKVGIIVGPAMLLCILYLGLAAPNCLLANLHQKAECAAYVYRLLPEGLWNIAGTYGLLLVFVYLVILRFVGFKVWKEGGKKN